MSSVFSVGKLLFRMSMRYMFHGIHLIGVKIWILFYFLLWYLPSVTCFIMSSKFLNPLRNCTWSVGTWTWVHNAVGQFDATDLYYIVIVINASRCNFKSSKSKMIVDSYILIPVECMISNALQKITSMIYISMRYFYSFVPNLHWSHGFGEYLLIVPSMLAM